MNEQATTGLERRPSAGGPLVLLALVVLVAAALFFVNPGEHGLFPPCIFHKLTGLNCPGCGATRAAYALVHGHLVTALHDNALLVLSLPLLAGYAVSFVRRYRAGKRPPGISSGLFWIGLGVMMVFTVWRNLPCGAWLSP